MVGGKVNVTSISQALMNELNLIKTWVVAWKDMNCLQTIWAEDAKIQH